MRTGLYSLKMSVQCQCQFMDNLVYNIFINIYVTVTGTMQPLMLAVFEMIWRHLFQEMKQR